MVVTNLFRNFAPSAVFVAAVDLNNNKFVRPRLFLNFRGFFTNP